jgi:hypothetical protein
VSLEYLKAICANTGDLNERSLHHLAWAAPDGGEIDDSQTGRSDCSLEFVG